MHILPQLRKLEEKYRQELAVIGVHSAKFPSERLTENVRKAVQRHRIEHPVVNDHEFAIWSQYAVRAWPTLMFIDPQGMVVGRLEGEAPFESLDRLVAGMIAEYDSQGLLARASLAHGREQEQESSLSFPGKVAADEARRRLFIADSNHNRILAASLDGRAQAVIGTGEAGFQDGALADARFNQPQGMALVGDTLYVADTENHAIRRVDLARGVVETIAGTGQQAARFHGGGKAREVALSSPWDLALHRDRLFIAMAGFHQLWVLDLDAAGVRPYAGTGREGLVDGPLGQAWLAQPSGLITDGEHLFFADSETSSIRVADLSADGAVRTIVGRDLFVFGDTDGAGDAVQLQHPLGLCVHDGVLFVADSYNNKIKRVFPRTRGAVTFAGTGEPGLRDGPAQEALFHEPGGVAVAGDKLYIADTNNHAIRIADLRSGQVSTLRLTGL